jgi:hypothetical protein
VVACVAGVASICGATPLTIKKLLSYGLKQRLRKCSNTNIANVGDATGLRGSTAAGSLFLSLHTADPGEAGDQTTSECNYTGYARVGIARTSGGFTASANQITNAAAINFAQCTAGANTAKFWQLGTASSGAGLVTRRGALRSNPKIFAAAASSDIFTVYGHTLAVNDRVVVQALLDGTFPTGTGLSDGADLYVKTVSGNDITLSTTQGGSTLDVTANGVGVISKAEFRDISAGITPSFAIGALSMLID